MVERTVSFEASGEEETHSGQYQVLRFAIEPPIQVHDPSFLNRALLGRMFAAGHKYYFSGYEYVKDTNITFSDEHATHGTTKFHVVAQEEGQIDAVRELIETVFTEELNPLGKVALSFDFEADFPRS